MSPISFGRKNRKCPTICSKGCVILVCFFSFLSVGVSKKLRRGSSEASTRVFENFVAFITEIEKNILCKGRIRLNSSLWRVTFGSVSITTKLSQDQEPLMKPSSALIRPLSAPQRSLIGAK